MAAQAAINEKNWDAALAQLQEAQAVEPKTEYDAFMIDELGWYVQLQKKDYVQSAAALERIINSQYIAEADKPQRLRALTQMELQNKQFDKALQYGTAYLQTNPGDTEIALAMAQARYLAGDFAGAKTASEQLVASNAKPPEAALLLALRSNYELKNDAGTIPGARRAGTALPAAEVLGRPAQQPAVPHQGRPWTAGSVPSHG